MLQQTRVDQVVPYYRRFLAAFPAVSNLAAAKQDAVLLVWEGLGYYARARNLHRAAQIVVDRYGGRIPETYDELRALPGIGPYTAGAVLSMAFDMPVAAVDANAYRVLARAFAVDRMRTIHEIAAALVPAEAPGAFNQALMELGATVCTPRAPDCPACPLRSACRALALDATETFPARKPRRTTPHYDVAAGVLFDHRGRILIQRRDAEALLGGLWELPGGKRDPGETMEEACRRELREELGIEVDVREVVQTISHAYSHFRITLYVFRCHILDGEPTSARPLRWVLPSALKSFAFPRANRRVLDSLMESSEHAPASGGAAHGS